MLKDAIDRIIMLAEPKILTLDGREYSDKPLHQIRKPKPAVLEFKSLRGFVDYINEGVDTLSALKLMVVVVNESRVELVEAADMNEGSRRVLAGASAFNCEFDFGRYMRQDVFSIGVQCHFVDTPQRADMLKLTGSITEGEIRISDDDGVSQEVTAKASVFRQDRMEIPNPITLQPYRTFREVEQPTSPFILRVDKGPVLALMEADGSKWKLEAMRVVGEWVDTNVTSQIPVLA